MVKSEAGNCIIIEIIKSKTLKPNKSNPTSCRFQYKCILSQNVLYTCTVMTYPTKRSPS